MRTKPARACATFRGRHALFVGCIAGAEAQPKRCSHAAKQHAQRDEPHRPSHCRGTVDPPPRRSQLAPRRPPSHVGALSKYSQPRHNSEPRARRAGGAALRAPAVV
eukprot:scaffold1564_cov389-Prasinococcus_capsulatus_cf.AAC.8